MKGENLGKIKKSSSGWFELDKKIKINPQDGICYFENDELRGCLVNKVENSRIYINKKITIKEGTQIYRNYDYEFEKLLTNSKILRKIKVNFEYKDGILKVTDEDKNSTQIKITETEKPKNPDKMKETFKTQLSKTGESIFYVDNIEIKGNVPFLPISKINEIRRKILDDLKEKKLKNYKRETQTPLKYTQYPTQIADYHENIHNKEAEEFYKNCGCIIKEKSIESTNNFKEKELMRTKHCLKYAFNMCKSPQKLFLIDERGKKYSLNFDCKNCEMVIKINS